MKWHSDLKSFPKYLHSCSILGNCFNKIFSLCVHQSHLRRLVKMWTAGPTARVSDSVGLECGLGISHLRRIPRKCWCCCSEDHTLGTKNKRKREQERKNKEEMEREVRDFESERDPPWLVWKGLWAREYRWPLEVESRSHRQRTAKSILDKKTFFKANINCKEVTLPTATFSMATITVLEFPRSPLLIEVSTFICMTKGFLQATKIILCAKHIQRVPKNVYIF